MAAEKTNPYGLPSDELTTFVWGIEGNGYMKRLICGLQLEVGSKRDNSSEIERNTRLFSGQLGLSLVA